VIDIGRPWLRFLGWWREPGVVFQYQGQLDQYVTWMRDERAFTPSTVEQWSRMIGRFLGWCEQTNRQLSDLRAEDIDAYFVSQATGRWARVSVANTASALRGFLRAAKRGMCADHVAASICRPRLYQQESLPYAPDWSDVQRMLADAETDKPRDIRDRAILLLLAVYGMRSGEVVALRLDQIDWTCRTLRLFRLKRRQPQIYPLVPSAAEALARYIDTVRPTSSCPEVFLRMQAPRRPLMAGSIYDVANRRFAALGIDAAHRGGHALRHACASRLLAEGLSSPRRSRDRKSPRHTSTAKHRAPGASKSSPPAFRPLPSPKPKEPTLSGQRRRATNPRLPRADSSRNGGRHQIGMVGGLGRNHHSGTSFGYLAAKAVNMTDIKSSPYLANSSVAAEPENR
jgi:integrase/recombinase XerD